MTQTQELRAQLSVLAKNEPDLGMKAATLLAQCTSFHRGVTRSDASLDAMSFHQFVQLIDPLDKITERVCQLSVAVSFLIDDLLETSYAKALGSMDVDLNKLQQSRAAYEEFLGTADAVSKETND